MQHFSNFAAELPANLDAEGALIGAVLMRNELFRACAQVVDASAFFEPIHRTVWQTIAAMIEKGFAANPITLKSYLGDADVGGLSVTQYLISLVTKSTNLESAPEYARLIQDAANRRALIAVCQETLATAYNAPVDATAASIFADVETKLEALRPTVGGSRSDFEDFGTIGCTAVYEAYRRGTGLVGLSSGLPRLDEVLGGLQNSDLIIIGGRPGSGKTSLATNIAVHVARHVQERRKEGESLGNVGFFSLEMGAPQLKARICCDIAGVPLFVLNRGLGTKDQMERFANADRELNKLPLSIDATGGLSIAQIKMRARGLKKRRGLSLLVVDYLQLLKGSRRHNNRNEEVGEISSGLKELAKELDVPIIALAQLSRGVDGRDDKRPMLADLRESGNIEQDADSVLFVFREEYYLRKAEPRKETEAWFKWDSEMRRAEGVAEIIVAKNRHGDEGRAELGFEGKFTRFTNGPGPRRPDPAEYRERAQDTKRSLPKASTVLHGLIRNLSATHSEAPTAEQRAMDRRLLAGAKLVPVDIARRAFATELMPDASEQSLKTAFTNAFAGLRMAGIALYFGNDEVGYSVWLPELVAK